MALVATTAQLPHDLPRVLVPLPGQQVLVLEGAPPIGEMDVGETVPPRRDEVEGTQPGRGGVAEVEGEVVVVEVGGVPARRVGHEIAGEGAPREHVLHREGDPAGAVELPDAVDEAAPVLPLPPERGMDHDDVRAEPSRRLRRTLELLPRVAAPHAGGDEECGGMDGEDGDRVVIAQRDDDLLVAADLVRSDHEFDTVVAEFRREFEGIRRRLGEHRGGRQENRGGGHLTNPTDRTPDWESGMLSGHNEDMHVDHMIFASGPDGIRADAERLADLLGADFKDGGFHPRFGTRNHIIPLANARYIEVVEVLDHPAAEKAPFGQAVRTRSEMGGGWLGWVVSVDEIAPYERRLERSSVPGSRQFPDGRKLEWRQLGIQGLIADPQLPYFLQWVSEDLLRPSALTSDVQLTSVRLSGSAERLSDWLGVPVERDLDGVAIDMVAPNAHPGVIEVTFESPRKGTVVV